MNWFINPQKNYTYHSQTFLICLNFHPQFNFSITSFKVRVGEWDASGTAEPIPAQDVTVSNVFLHPNFNKDNLQNDVAILKLATPVSLTAKSTVGTVCLPTVSFVGQRCYVAGWGKNDFGPTGAYQAIQREVDVPLVTNVACQTSLRATRLGASFVLDSSSFICAGGEPGKDACTVSSVKCNSKSNIIISL